MQSDVGCNAGGSAPRSSVACSRPPLLRRPRVLDHRIDVDLTRGGLVVEVKAIASARAALDAYEYRVVVAIDALADSGLDSAGVLRSVGRVSQRTASRVSATAARMAQLPATAASLAAGEITAEHANTIADAAEQMSASLVDSHLARAATQAPADVFAKRARQWVSDQQTETDIAQQHQHQRRNRSMKAWTDRDGMGAWFTRLDSVDSAAVKSSLDTEYERLWRIDGGRDMATPDEVRTPQQRMADAFVSMVTGTDNSASRPTQPPHVRQQLLVIVDHSRLTIDDPSGRARLVDGTPLPQHLLEHLACNSEITGVVFDGPGKVLWTGRTHRQATTVQWRSLVARDKGCVGCTAGPNRCEAHHVVPWHDNGRTDIDNLVLVCSQCHHNLHNRGMCLSRDAQGNWQITPRAGPGTAEPH